MPYIIFWLFLMRRTQKSKNKDNFTISGSMSLGIRIRILCMWKRISNPAIIFTPRKNNIMKLSVLTGLKSILGFCHSGTMKIYMFHGQRMSCIAVCFATFYIAQAGFENVLQTHWWKIFMEDYFHVFVNFFTRIVEESSQWIGVQVRIMVSWKTKGYCTYGFDTAKHDVQYGTVYCTSSTRL